jgi:hypothetical protein
MARSGSEHESEMKSKAQAVGILLALLAGIHPVAAQLTFASAATYGTGCQPASVTATDVNGDGKLDLIEQVFPLLTLLDAPEFTRLATDNPKSGPALPPGGRLKDE